MDARENLKPHKRHMARSNSPPRSSYRTLPHMSQTTSSFSTYSCNSDCWSARRAHFNMVMVDEEGLCESAVVEIQNEPCHGTRAVRLP
jgi:hypothetical protein